MLGRPPNRTQPPADEGLVAAWQENRRLLLDVAYRMLGSLTDAEDVVQEAFARLMRQDLSDIDDARGWLIVVVTRLCLDQLRSARARHESYVGPWLPEPVFELPGDDPDPADRVTLDDSVRMALLIVLEQLSPAERAAFVLHDVFGFSYQAIGSIVGRSPSACRQLASRARRRVQSEVSPARFEVDKEELGRIVERFIGASNGGDLEALFEVLDPQVAGWTDTGGISPAPRVAIVGRERVANRLLTFLRAWNVTLRPMPVNGEPGAASYVGDDLIAVLAFEVRDGRITKIHSVANPAKLHSFSERAEARPAQVRDDERDGAISTDPT